MNMDIENILSIVVMIIILIISGLAGRRRRQAQQMNKAVPGAGQPATKGPAVAHRAAKTPSLDPFERLEQILTGQSSYESLEGESLEVIQDEEEAIVDEEEQIIQASNAEVQRDQDEPTIEEVKVPSYLERLFRDQDEITRAVIYSEIFPRKYK
jgi:hypothetical protein